MDLSPEKNHVHDDLGAPSAAVLLISGEDTSRAPGFVPVANVQLLIRTSVVLSSIFMTSSVVHFTEGD